MPDLLIFKFEGLVKSHPYRRLCRRDKVKARESRGPRRTGSTPQRRRDEAQRGDWPSYEVVKNENGYIAIVATLAILTLLTVIGISASRVANTELTRARNEVVHKRNFYLAEGAALEAADRLHFYGNLKDHPQPWMEMVTGNLDIDSLKYYWDNTATQGDTVIPKPSEVDLVHTAYLTGDEGIAHGHSLGMDKPTVHTIGIYGRCDWNGVAIIKLGYRAAY